MNEKYGVWYQELKNALGTMQENDIYEDMNKVVGSGRSNISLNRKLMEKSIDVSWVEAIENGLIHVDNVIRRPSRTIVDVEEIVPIALSRKVTVESVKHLAQHTDLIIIDPLNHKNNVAKNTRQFKNIKLAFTLGVIAAREQCECGCHYETECLNDCMKIEHCILKRIFNAVKRYSLDDTY